MVTQLQPVTTTEICIDRFPCRLRLIGPQSAGLGDGVMATWYLTLELTGAPGAVTVPIYLTHADVSAISGGARRTARYMVDMPLDELLYSATKTGVLGNPDAFRLFNTAIAPLAEAWANVVAEFLNAKTATQEPEK